MGALSKTVLAGEASQELARLGVPPNERVLVVRRERMIELANQIRALARERGMTDELLAELLKDDGA